MAFTHGKNAVFSLDDSGGTLRALTSFTDNVSGLPGGRGLSETTPFGSQGVSNIPGLVNVTFTASGSWDSTATTGPNAVLNSLRSASATATFEYGPEGSTTGKVRYTGECWLTTYTADATVADKVSWSASFQVEGTVTANTYP